MFPVYSGQSGSLTITGWAVPAPAVARASVDSQELFGPRPHIPTACGCSGSGRNCQLMGRRCTSRPTHL